ncbi:MAG: SDR family NAD(P)-dependent oxidoreductase [Rhodocyclaceae bacterium]|jgi:NADP-dependent 3-hydroxy acid dehydrogenase YdfG|nr:SDR family NAD(P)-dependent oxidoreductase [Rhodocyclaceae bacterium]
MAETAGNGTGIERWRGRVALVTGASGGIGEAIARRLAGAGMKVALVARRAERVRALADELTAAGAQAMACPGDLRSPEQVLAIFSQVERQWGPLDLLVNNAGTGMMGPLAEGKWEDWVETMNVNVAAPALCAREALRTMVSRPDTQIINICSIYGHRGQVPGFAFYQASKFALRALTDTLRAELFASGARVRVSMISPGMVATEFRGRASGGAFTYESYFEKLQPLLPADIADAVGYILSTPGHVQVQDILLSPLGQGL